MDYIHTSLSWYDITDLVVPIMNWLYGGCLLRYKNCLPFASTRVHIRVLVGSVLLIFSASCVVWLCVFCCLLLISPSVFFNVYYIATRLLLTRKLLNQALLLICLNVTEQLCHKSPWLCSVCRNQNLIRSPFITFHQVCKKSNTLGAIS